MNFIEEAKKLMDDADCGSTALAIYSRKEGRIVTIQTMAEYKEHQQVSIKLKLKDLFAGLK